MESAQQLSNRLKDVVLSGKWIANTNFKEQLTGLNWQLATTSYNGLNSIAALTFHINYYIAGIIEVFEGRNLTIKDKYSFEMPAITSQEQWEQLAENLYLHVEKFAAHVAAMSDEQLNSVFVDEKYGTYRRNIEGMIEHCYYHFGQIVIIKKLLLQQEENNN